MRASLGAVALSLLVLVIQEAEGSCQGEFNITRYNMAKDYSLNVTASFSSDGSVLSLSCTVTNGATLQPGQELVWFEGGIEIQVGAIGYLVHQTNISSLLTISVTHGLQYGEYGCQCHNRHNYTHNSLSKLIATGSFIQHCSNLNTTVAIPDTASSPTITTHYVSVPGQSVSIICNQSGSVLARESGGILEEVTNTFSVSSPGHQGKFVCIKAGTVVEIHYVVIEGYRPIRLIFPTTGVGTLLLPFSVGSTSPPTLCGIYSPIPLQSFRMVFRSGEAVVGGLSFIYSSSGPLGEDLWRASLVPNKGNNDILESLDLNCRVQTVWETVTSERYKVDFEESDNGLVPAVCVSTSLTPSSVVISGSSVLITCTVEYDIESPINITIIHEGSNGSLYEYAPLYDSSSNVYYLNLTNVSREKDSGNYTCSVSVYGYTAKIKNVVALNIIIPPTSTSKVTHASSMYSFPVYQNTFTVLFPSISSTRSTSTDYSETPSISATSIPGSNTPGSSLSIEMIIVLAVGLSLIFIVSVAIGVAFFILMWQNCSSKKIEISIDLPPSLTHPQGRRAKENDYINDHPSMKMQRSQD